MRGHVADIITRANFWQTVYRFRGYNTPNFAILHRNSWSPLAYNSVNSPVLHCDSLSRSFMYRIFHTCNIVPCFYVSQFCVPNFQRLLLFAACIIVHARAFTDVVDDENVDGRYNHARSTNHWEIADLPPPDSSQHRECLIHLHLRCLSPCNNSNTSSQVY